MRKFLAVEYEFNLKKRLREELASTVQIRVYSYDDRIARGVVTSMQDKREISFSGLDQAVLIIEELLDRNRDISFDYRHFDAWGEYESWLDHQSGFQVWGYSQNFLVRVYERKYRSLQGELRMEERKCCFRSGMELMRLIHQCLQKKYEKPITVAGGR